MPHRLLPRSSPFPHPVAGSSPGGGILAEGVRDLCAHRRCASCLGLTGFGELTKVFGLWTQLYIQCFRLFCVGFASFLGKIQQCGRFLIGSIFFELFQQPDDFRSTSCIFYREDLMLC